MTTNLVQYRPVITINRSETMIVISKTTENRSRPMQPLCVKVYTTRL